MISSNIGRPTPGMKSHANPRPLTFQVTLIVLALAAFSLAVVVDFGFFATLKTDRDSLEKQKAFVAAGIAGETAELVRQQTSVTVWDDSVTAAGRRPGVDVGKSRRMDACLLRPRPRFVLDAAGRPIHAMRDGKTLAPSLRGGPRHRRAVRREAARPDAASSRMPKIPPP